MFTQRKYLLRQCTAAFACFIESIGGGVVLAFTGTLFPQLEADRKWTIDKEDETWIASSAILSMAFGCILGGLAMPHLTRKLLILSTNLLIIAGFLCLYFAHDVMLLLVGRVLCGLGMGVSRPVIVTIVAEVAPPNLRTVFTNLIMLGHMAGALFSDITATFASWRTNAIVTCAYPTVAIALFALLPETYGSHLGSRKHRNIKSATEQFHWYRGYDHAARIEVTQVVHQAQTYTSPSTLTLLNVHFLKAFVICATFFAAGQLNGINVLSLYSVQMFQRMFQNINANYITIAYDGVKIAASLTSFYVVKRYKLRTLTFISAAGVICSLIALSVLHYLEQNTADSMEATRYNILTCVVLVLYVQFLLCGLAPLPWVVPPELFERHVVGIGSGCTIFLNYIIYFLAVKFSPALLEMSYSLTFGVFALLTMALAVVLWFILPETKNKTLLDAQATLN